MTSSFPAGGSPNGSARLQSMRIMAGALTAALVFIGIALYFTMSSSEDGLTYPSPLVPLVQGVAFVALWVLIEVVGYRATAIEPGTPPDRSRRSAVAAYSSLVMVRFALAESLAVVSVAWAFVTTPASWWVYVTGAFYSLVLMVVHVWPGARTVRKVEASLDRDGGRSQLADELGLGSSPGGVVQAQ